MTASVTTAPQRIVRLTRDMRPWRTGDDIVVPLEQAELLVKNGEGEDIRPYPPADVAPPPGGSPTNLVGVTAIKPKRYLTRKRG